MIEINSSDSNPPLADGSEFVRKLRKFVDTWGPQDKSLGISEKRPVEVVDAQVVHE
jgi:hypothetical protein